MKFKNLLKEIFADDRIEKLDGYKKQVVRDEQPNIIKNGLNDVNPDGTLKKRKRGEVR